MFTHEVFDDLGIVKRFKSHREAKWFAEVNQLKIRSTGYKAPIPLDPYTTALAEVGECLLQEMCNMESRDEMLEAIQVILESYETEYLRQIFEKLTESIH